MRNSSLAIVARDQIRRNLFALQISILHSITRDDTTQYKPTGAKYLMKEPLKTEAKKNI